MQSRAAHRPEVGVGGAQDIGPHVQRAGRGGRLDGPELLAVLNTLVAADRLADALRSERLPLLHHLGRQIKTVPQLRARLAASLDPAGELLDSASPALGGLRRGVRVAYERLRSRLERRGLPRDRGKLDAFDTFVARMRPDVAPPVPHLAVDNRLGRLPIADQLHARIEGCEA